jgi:hypothetical protein
MFHFFQHLAAKTLGVVASAIIAVGIVKVPQPLPPVVAQHHNATATAQSFFTAFDVATSTTTPTSTLPTVIKKQNNKVSTTKTVELSPSLTPAPAQAQSGSDNAQNVSYVAGVIVNAAADLANDTAQITQLSGQENSDVHEYVPYLNSGQIGAWQKFLFSFDSQLSSISSSIITYQKDLLNTRTQILASNNFDYQYWVNTGIPDITNQQKKYKDEILYLNSIYSQTVTAIKNATANNANSAPTPQYTAPAPTANSQFQTLCTNVDSDIRQEIQSGGGTANESQIEALVQQRKQKLGCYNGSIPTAICNDFTPSYSTDRSGTCSDHGGVYIWY